MAFSAERPPAPARAEEVLTAAAVAHLKEMARVVAPRAAGLLRRFSGLLAAKGYDPACRKAISATTPASAAAFFIRPRPVERFVEQATYSGRRLAKLNVPPPDVLDSLRLFDPLLDAVLADRFRPAREQLHLATVMAVNNAFYEVREGETQAFFGLARAEADAHGLEDLLRRSVRVLAKAFGARAGSIVLTQDFPAALAKPVYIASRPAAVRSIRDPQVLARGRSWWSFPMGTDGILQLAFPQPYPWLPRERELVSLALERCRQAIERARLLEDLAARERQVVRLAAEARRAEEEERRRIGRELHDETSQSLLVLRLQLELAERDAPEALRSRIASARAALEKNITGLRRLIAALSPAVLERLGLEAALRQMATRWEKQHSIPIRVRLAIGTEPVPPPFSEVVYRVAQECLNNIYRHARASHVNLSVRTADKGIRLSVADNGAGFDAEAALRKPMSFGLAGMRERAAVLGGTLTIRSSPGKGSTVILELPRRSAGTARYGKNSHSTD